MHTTLHPYNLLEKTGIPQISAGMKYLIFEMQAYALLHQAPAIRILTWTGAAVADKIR